MSVSEDCGNHLETVVLDMDMLQKMDTDWFQGNRSDLGGFSVERVFDSISSKSELKVDSISLLTKSGVVMTVFYMYQLLSYESWMNVIV